jgi:hypothetical protein
MCALLNRPVFRLLLVAGVAAITSTVVQAKPDDKDKPKDKKERIVSVPEPGTLLLLAAGIGGGIVAERVRRRRAGAQL